MEIDGVRYLDVVVEEADRRRRLCPAAAAVSRRRRLGFNKWRWGNERTGGDVGRGEGELRG